MDDASKHLGLESIHVYDHDGKELGIASAYVSFSQLHIKIQEA